MEKCYLYIVLTRTNTVMSKLIQVVKNDAYTHAAISLDKELNHMYSFGRRNTYNPFIGRFRKEDINEGVYKFCNTLHGAIIEVEVSKQQYEKAKVILDHFISNSHLYKYNYNGLVHSMLNKPVCNDYSFLCSEFVYHILKESGIADLKISRNLVRPQNLLNIEGRMIYKGNLKKIKLSENNLYANEIGTRRLSAIYE
ncbi:hypothetical protein [Clostridium aminobutyricum]|uniref:Uncharacterized protein n=1 Tax=Clostridium aminobutyricum TaxID=33953 RepID=A0A939D732_CLOAM|nr:hypothetical protein [Clostridium aminobutyricum]MBN7772276.1 hypothetical protein [Clostridium aminobutyricum]